MKSPAASLPHHFARSLILIGALLSFAASPVQAQLAFNFSSLDQTIRPIGPASLNEEDTQALLVIREWAKRAWQNVGFQSATPADWAAKQAVESEEVSLLYGFTTNYPASFWTPAIQSRLGSYYLQAGRYSLASETWDRLWQSTKDIPEGRGKQEADYALAQWTRMLASLGRTEVLAALIEETRGRILDQGPLSQMWARTREAYVEMLRRPGTSFQCGTFAMEQVARESGLTFDSRSLLSVPSPSTGFNMKTLADLSAQFGLGLVPVARLTGDQLLVPSVVHWREEHYGAIVSREGMYYKVVDPTFGRVQYMTADAINAEASGMFMIPATRIPLGWRVMVPAETELIYGRGQPNFLSDPDDQQCCGFCPPGVGGNGGGGGGGGKGGIGGWQKPSYQARPCCGGMPIWQVSEPYINLWLLDEPLGYEPALGPRVSFQLAYRQRDENPDTTASYSSVGKNWNCEWLSYMYMPIPGGSYLTYAYRGTGGMGTYITPESTATDYINNTQIHAVTNGSGWVVRFERTYHDGSQEIFGFNPTNIFGPTKYFYLTQKIDPQGRALNFQYENYDPDDIVVRLKYVVDGDGHTNTITYATSGYSTNLITQVTDAFGRSTSLQYSSTGLLTNLTDVVGLSTSFTYDGDGWPSTMKTPYGTTSFVPVNENVGNPADINRYIHIMEPDGSKQLYAYVQDPAYESSLPSSPVPTNTPLNTLDSGLAARNSYYWGRQQYAALTTTNIAAFVSDDYIKARMRHWLGFTVHDVFKSVDTLAVERAMSQDGINGGQVTWYDHVNKPDTDVQGDQVLPAVAAQVMPDGSTWYTWYQRNGVGTVTNQIEKWVENGVNQYRTNTFIYSADGVDLIKQIDPAGVQVSSNLFNAFHQVATNFNALNEMTRYTYDGNHQLQTVSSAAGLTTTNIYLSAGSAIYRLDKTIDIEINRTNVYTYYTNGLINTHTDERGLARTFTWDNLQRLTGMTFPDNSVSSNIYTYLDLTATKDRLNNWSYTGYDAIRRTTAETNALGTITRYGYCDCGALRYITNAFGTAIQQVTTLEHDYQGNLTYVLAPDGVSATTNWFNPLQQMIATGDGVSLRWFGYNNHGLQTSITNGVGVENRTVFDTEDRPFYVTDANGVTVTNTYDNLGRLLTRTYPDGGVQKLGYTSFGLAKFTNQLSLVTSYGYDAALRKTAETNANSEIIRYTYNAASDLKTLTDGISHVTTWNYDEYGRMTNKLDQASVEILRYQYDANSRLTNRWSKAKTNTVYTFDNVGNLTKIDYPSGTTDITLSYDALSRLTNMVDAVGTTKFTYDAVGLLNTEDGPWTSDTMTYTYTNRLIKSFSLQQATGSWTNGFTYDAARRLSNVLASAGTFVYSYQTPGKLVKKIALPNTSYITNTFDAVGRITSTLLNDSSHTTLDKNDYLYNADNQRIRDTRADTSYYTNTYDNIGQLKVSDSTVAAEDRGYVYDAAWNLSVRTNNGSTTAFGVDSKNQLTNGPTANYVSDDNGNLTSASSGGFTFGYDAENQLTNVQKTASKRTAFIYDGFRRLRIVQEFNWKSSDSSWDPVTETRYLYFRNLVIQERSSANTPAVSYVRGTDVSGSFEGAGGIGGLLSRSHAYQSGSGSFTNHNYYHADGNGNITYMVNTNQTVAASYRYDPFGNTISSSGTLASANPYRFSSKAIFSTTLTNGVYYYGYRFYDPNLQRWLNRDPLGELGSELIRRTRKDFQGDDPNLYLFVNNLPNGSIDPFGLEGKGGDQNDVVKCMLKCDEIGKLLGENWLKQCYQNCMDHKPPPAPIPKPRGKPSCLDALKHLLETLNRWRKEKEPKPKEEGILGQQYWNEGM